MEDTILMKRVLRQCTNKKLLRCSQARVSLYQVGNTSARCSLVIARRVFQSWLGTHSKCRSLFDCFHSTSYTHQVTWHINLFARRYNCWPKFNLHVNFLHFNLEVDKMSLCQCLILLLPIGHSRSHMTRVPCKWRCGEHWIAHVSWLLDVSASPQQALHHGRALLGNLETGIQWKLPGILERTGWEIPLQGLESSHTLLVGLGLYFTMSVIILSFVCDPKVCSLEINEVYIATFAFSIISNNCLFWDYRTHMYFLIVIIHVFKSIYSLWKYFKIFWK